MAQSLPAKKILVSLVTLISAVASVTFWNTAEAACRKVQVCVQTKTITVPEPTGQYRQQCTQSEFATICVDVPIFKQVQREICAKSETREECDPEPPTPLQQPK